MKKYFSVVFFLVSFNAFASDEFFGYQVSCVPELEEFRVDVDHYSISNELDLYEASAKYGIKVTDISLKEQNVLSDFSEEVSCRFNEKTYKMRFIKRKPETTISSPEYYKSHYQTDVILSVDGEDIAEMFPLGSGEDGFFFSMGIRGAVIFASGGKYVGAENQFQKYLYWEVPVDNHRVIDLRQLDESMAVPPVYNAVQFLCREENDTSVGIFNFRFYPLDKKMPENYGYLSDSPLFNCGDMRVAFERPNEVTIYRNGEKYSYLKLDNMGYQIYQIKTYQSLEYGDVFVRAVDKTGNFYKGIHCHYKQNCTEIAFYEKDA